MTEYAIVMTEAEAEAEAEERVINELVQSAIYQHR